MRAHRHRVQAHPSGIAGIEAMTLDSTHVFPRHAHDTFGIGIMLAGAQRSWSLVGHVEALPGDVVMLNPGEMHDGMPLAGARRWRIIYLEPGVVWRALGNEGLPADVTLRPVATDRKLGADVNRLFGQLQRDPPDSLLVEECLVRCLMRVIERHEVRGAQTPCASPSIAAALRRLDEAPELPVCLEELARSCDATRFQLLRGFSREIGTTPHAYLVQRRVRMARRLLATGLAPAEAAARTGFADQSHLTRAFARHFGITPGKYRAAVTRID